MSKIFGQSTKESYKNDIETSRKQKTIYKIYEYFDDHSYCKSKALGFYLQKDEEEMYLYLFQEDGPKKIETLRKLLEWRRSGKSNEIGHKGGGNKRNIYGYECEEAYIIMKIDEKHAIRCCTSPNKLYQLSISDIDEETFRSESDSSTYITNPEQIKIKNLPAWYSHIYEKIKNESNINPNYIIRLELSKLPEEYSSLPHWNEFVNQVRAKQYDIPIYFKNEFLDMETYKTYSNIDLVGALDNNKIHQVDVKLYIDKNTKNFYVYHNNKYINVKDKNDTTTVFSNEFIEWGKIEMYIVNKDYITNQLKIYNENAIDTLRHEDLYGVYLYLNDKFTNYKPMGPTKLLGDSRNNNIDKEEGQKNNGRFRMIFKPNKKECENSNIFDSLIQTKEIKALTEFLDKSPWKSIIDICMKNIYKGDSLEKQKPIKKVKINKIKSGGVYVVYFGNGLWKFGLVEAYKEMNNRINKHKNESIQNIKDFINFLSDKNISNKKVCIPIYKLETCNPQGMEEKIMKLIESNKQDKITIFQSNRSQNKIREYFVCNDFDYILKLINNNLE